MATLLPLSFLRPRALVFPSTATTFLRASRQFLSTSTATTSSSSDAPPTKPTTPKNASPSPPPARVSRATRTRTPRTPPSQSPSATPSTPATYKVNRTPSNQLPIYHLSKAGGNQKLTRIRKIDGDVGALRDELQKALGMADKEVVVNELTRQVVIKGHKKFHVERFLAERGM